MSGMFDPRIAEAFALLPDYLRSHVLVSVAALALGLAVSLPLAFASVRRPRLRRTVLAVASVIQTVPGLALLALFYPLLLALAALADRLFGVSFSALGFLPSVLALALYSMLPVLQNTVTGLAEIDPAVKEAALGVGMTRRQMLVMVDLPLALPIIMAGIRTASVWVIGMAALSTPIGQTSLGNYIFSGLQTQNWIFVLFGCVAAAALALVVDQALAAVERGLRTRRRPQAATGALVLLAVIAGALVPGLSGPQARTVVGAKPFAEQYVLAALIEQRLDTAGLPTVRREGLGSNIVFDALAAGDIDVYVEYSGTLWANQLKRNDVRPGAEVLATVARWLEEQHGVRVVGKLGFENAYALAMSRRRAEALNIRSIADLARHAREMSIGGDYEFFRRPEWRAIRDAYGLGFREERQMQPEFMYPAAAAGDLDVISAYTSDGRLAKFDLLVLDDPRHVIPPYDAILLVSPKGAKDQALMAALQPLAGAVDVTLMRAANLRASAGGGDSSPDAVARWLWDEVQRRRAAAR